MDTGVLGAAYRPLIELVAGLDEQDAWSPTGCAGWCVRDLVHHLWGDAQRALVALHTPADGPADRDAVTYWTDWQPPAAEATGWRYHRVVASMFGRWEQLRQEYVDTAAAVLHAVGEVAPDVLLRTQGHTLSAADLASTLAVEAAIHHLDLVRELPDLPGPSAAALAEARRIVTALAPMPMEWPDERCVLLGTARAEPSPDERRELSGVRLPAFG